MHSNPPHFLFLHGLQSNQHIFAPVRQRLGEAFPNPHISYDFIGFGNSERVPDFDCDLMSQAEQLKMFLNEVSVEELVIIGHSLGGMVGTLLLKTMPDQVVSLISMEGNLVGEDCSESRIATAVPFEDFESSYYPALKERLRDSDEPSGSFRASALSIIDASTFYKTSQSIVSWSESGELRDIFENTSQPKLLIRGEKSGFKSCPVGPDIEHATIPDSGHFMLLDNPDAVSAAIIAFLRP